MKLYLRFFSIQLRSAMEYKVSFFFMVLGQLLSAGTAFITIFFLFQRFHQVGGFTYSQVLLCFAVVLAAFSLAEVFFRGLDTFATIIATAEFDRILVRPRNEVFQVVASKLDISRIGRLIQALLVFCYAIPASGVAWTPDKICVLVLMVLCGALFFGSLFLVYAAFCFFTTEGLEFMNIVTDGGREFGSYPLSVYGAGVLRFMTYCIPMACFQYYPFLYLTGIDANPLYGALPLCSALFILPCYLFWRFGLRRYRSTGS